MSQFDEYRTFMKSQFGKWEEDIRSDQESGVPQPPMEEPYPEDAKTIGFPSVESLDLRKPDIRKCLKDRRSRRAYADIPLSKDELGYLLWSSIGVERVIPAYRRTGYATLRTVPSAGARHAFETYLAINNVDSLDPGVYRYLAMNHTLLHVAKPKKMKEKLIELALGQGFAGVAPAVFFWVCIPYRGEWRYHHEAHKVMLLDVGHICQNLYLAAESIECGTCAIAAYDQDKADAFLGLDGEDAFVVYFAPLGKMTK